MRTSIIERALWLPVCLVWLVITAPVGGAAADDKPMRDAGTFQAVWKSEKPIRLISRESVRIEIPPVPARAGVDTVLSLRTRLETTRCNGWNNYLAVTVNGRPVNAVDDLVRTRLINRPNVYNDKVYQRGQCILSNRLNTFFSPSFDRWDFHMREPVQTREKYWFILRVEDLLHADRPNVIELQDTAKFRDFGAKKAEEIIVVVDPLEVGYFQRPTPTITRKCELSAKTFRPAISLKRGKSAVEANQFGGLRISHGSGVFTVESAFSYPNAGFNVFSASLGKSQPGWRPRVRKQGRKIMVSAQGPHHGIKRVIELLDDRLDFYDAIENKSDKVLPVMALNTIGLDSVQESVWIGGMPNAGSFSISTRVDSQNSTVFINAKDVHAGIYAKDTVLRNQFHLESSPRVVTFGTKQLGIAPKTSCTLRWRLYLCGDADYFSFINRIRKDDDLNYTLIGPFDFLRYSQSWAGTKPEDTRKAFAVECWRVGNVMPWFDYYNGPLNPHSYNRPKFKALARSAVGNVTDAVPGFFILGGREITFFTVPRKGDLSKLPEADSFAKKADGSYSFIGEHCPDPASRYIFAYPALDNAYHKRLMGDVEFLMEECGYKGLYFDIFTVPGAVSYDRWDGHSVDIDPKTHTLVRKKNNVPILMGPAQTEMIKKIMSKGGIVVCNQSSTSEEMQALPVMSFVEGTYNCPTTHLYSPIGLCNMWTNFSDEEQKKGSTLVDQLTQRLRLGTLMYHYCPHLGLGPSEYEAYQILAHSFPITPVGLHAGWIEGEERTITCKPGTFTWHRPDRPHVLVWNVEGRRVRQAVPMVKGDDTWTVDLAKLPQGGVGIIEEDPYELARRTGPLPEAQPAVGQGDVAAGPITQCKLKNLLPDPGCERLIGDPARDSWSHASADKFVVEKKVSHRGKQSIRLNATDKDTRYGTYSGVGPRSEPVRFVEFGGWARVKPTEGKGGRPRFYAQIYLKDGKLIESTARFERSPVEWQFVGNRVPTGDREIKRVLLYCFVQGHKGPVWFDDVYVGYGWQPFKKGPNLIQYPGFEDTAKWRGHGLGFALDNQVKHGGKASLHLKAERPFRLYGARTVVKPDGPADAILIGGWCRSAETAGRASLTADVHYKDGRVLPCLSVIFPRGEHDWVNVEKEIGLIKADIDYISVTAELLHAPGGEVWLDDVYLHLLRR